MVNTPMIFKGTCSLDSLPAEISGSPVFPSVSLSHQEASIILLSFSIRRQTEWKPQSQKTNKNWSHGPQPCLTQWNYVPCHVGPPKTDRSWWRVLTRHGPLEKGVANHFSILALRPQWTVWKVRTYPVFKLKYLKNQVSIINVWNRKCWELW